MSPMARDAPPFKPRCTPPARGQEVAPGGRATPGIVTLFFTPPRPELRGIIRSHAKKGEGGGVCDPRVFCASKMPNFLARWRVRGRPAVRGPAGTGSVGDGGQGRVVPKNIACISVCGTKKYALGKSVRLQQPTGRGAATTSLQTNPLASSPLYNCQEIHLASYGYLASHLSSCSICPPAHSGHPSVLFLCL